jgi:TonB-linked SusC/RagA family outer membrane protein
MAAAPSDVVSSKDVDQVGKTVTGTVTDGVEPVIGASITVKGAAGVGTITDIEGDFSLGNVPENAVLIVSFVGYEPQEVSVAGKTIISIVLKEDPKLLDEVVVVGFGTQKKVNLTGAVTSITAEKFENRPVTNIGQALQGVVPNLNIGISTGQPNTVPSFNIRGGTTISGGSVSNGAPLILVDGVDFSATMLNQMNPNDIESMSVIKDASAAAIYGTKATFGVVLITTKSGKLNQKGRVSYSYDLSYDTPSALPDIMNTVDVLQSQQLVNEWKLGTTSDIEKLRLEKAKEYMANPTLENRYFENGGTIYWVMNNNPYDIVVRDWTPTHKHNVNISGGSEKITYYLSLGYQNQEGMYKISNDLYNRYNLMARFNAKVNDWFNVSAKVNYNRTDYNAPASNPESLPGAKGNLWSAAQREPEKNLMMPIKTLPTDPAPDAYTDNILAWMSYGAKSKSVSSSAALSITPEFILLPNILKAKAELSYTPQASNSTSSDPYHVYIKPGSWTQLNETSTASDGNQGSISKTTTDSYLINAYFDYTQTFGGKHNLAAIAGYSQEYVDYTSLSVNLKRLFSSDVLKPGAAEDITLHTSSTGAQRRTGRSVFGRINYNYDNKYLFEINGRYDGSSRFTPRERFVFFPSFSAGWRISEEAFMKDVHWLDNLKIRGSYGKLGSQPSDYYPYQAVMGTGQPGFILDGTYISSVNTPGLVSPTLTWEKAATTNAGIDITVLGNRLNASFDIYERKTTDILTTGTVAYPSILGATAPLENSGAIKANGWELEIKWNDRIEDFNYSVTATLADAVTTVLTYPANPTKTYGSLYDGKKVGEIWGYDFGGILQAEDLVLDGNKYIYYGPHASTYTVYPGYAWYLDRNGDGFISTGSGTVDNPGDYHIIGNSTPRYNYGLTLDASWNGFDLNVFFQGVGKRDYWVDSSTFWGSVGNGGSQWMWENSWKPDQTDAKYPMYGAVPSVCDYYLINAAYLRLKQLVLGYTLPTSIAQKIRADKIRFCLSGYNLMTLSEIPSLLDPTQMGDHYPQKKTFSVGAQITF